MRIDANSWYYSPEHGQICQVIEAHALWGETTCRVWVPGLDSVVSVPASKLKPLESAGSGSPEDIVYIAAGQRAGPRAPTQDVLLAPISHPSFRCRTRFEPCPALFPVTGCAISWQTRWAWEKPSRPGSSCGNSSFAGWLNGAW